MPESGLTRRSVIAAGAAAAGVAAAAAIPAPAHARPERYRWSNAQIVGGGFVPGIVFNQSEPGLVYARTDIGGAYRLDKHSGRWTPLLDWVGWDQWGYTGVASLATDAADPDRLYLAVGTYTNDWDPNKGAILRSRDRGASFKVSPLPFKLGGNMPGRGMGERLAIDPNRNNILYLAAPSGNGLWRSTDFGESWSKVESFPNAGTYRPDPNDSSGYNSDTPGVVWVVFDPRTGGRRRPTQTIYAGVADKENPLYRSVDGGSTWEAVSGTPKGNLAHKAVLDHTSGLLYVATSDSGGPYDGGTGEVFKLDTASGVWTRITPEASYFGYSGLTIDRQHPGTLIVASQISWWPDTIFFRTTNGGASWTRAWDFGPVWPDRINRYDLDISASPWLTWNQTPGAPEQAPKLGWMTESVEIDPFDSNRLFYGTGATIYGTTNLADWDSGGIVHIGVRAQGLEECAIVGLISPPVGPHLVSAVRDVGGFVHHDFAVATAMPDNPTFGGGTGLDFAGMAPQVIVRVGNPVGAHKRFGISRDSGQTWTPAATEPVGVGNGGHVAVSADGGVSLWAPENVAIHRSTDDGATWTPVTGLPVNAVIGSDRERAGVFYAFSAGHFFLSTDSGASFVDTGVTGLPAEGPVLFEAAPGKAGHVWLAGGKTGGVYGMFRSVDSGSTFVRVSALTEADNVGFGKAAHGSDYPAVFSSAKHGDQRGIYRSDDAGRHWVRINDDKHQWAWTGAAISGDPRVFGRVYVATNGRGIIVGDMS